MNHGQKEKTLSILLFILCLTAIFAYIIYTTYRDYEIYKNQEGLKKLTKKVSKTFKQVAKQGKQITKTVFSVKTIMSILKCPVSIFSNIQKCAWYYTQDKLFQLIWWILWVINFIIIYIPVFILDRIACWLFGKCLNLSPLDVCISKKGFFKFIENIYYMLSGGGRYLHRNSSDVKKCYCTPPVLFLFDPLRKFNSVFAKVSADSPNYTALVIPLTILGILAYSNK